MQSFQYVQASSVKKARAALGSSFAEARLKGAGIDLIDQLKERTIAPAKLVDVGHLDELKGLHWGDASLRIGAAVTLAELAADERLQREFPALAHAAGEAATPQVRNRATVAGNLCQRPRCWYFRSAELACPRRGDQVACPAIAGENAYHAIFNNGLCAMVHPSNLAPPLVALGGLVWIVGEKGERTVPADEFFVRPEQDLQRENILAPNELVRGVEIPLSPNSRNAYAEVRHKQSFDWPLANCAVSATLEEGKVFGARVVLGAVAPLPWRAEAAEKALEGKLLNANRIARAAEAALDGATPLEKNRYKLTTVKAVVTEALTMLAK